MEPLGDVDDWGSGEEAFVCFVLAYDLHVGLVVRKSGEAPVLRPPYPVALMNLCRGLVKDIAKALTALTAAIVGEEDE